jgi:hypothetical protein
VVPDLDRTRKPLDWTGRPPCRWRGVDRGQHGPTPHPRARWVFSAWSIVSGESVNTPWWLNQGGPPKLKVGSDRARHRNLMDDPMDGASIRQYIQIARLGGRSLETAVAHVSLWASGNRPPPQALFYHHVLLVLQVLDGSKALVRDAEIAERRLRKLDDSQVRVRNARLEWYGPERGLRALVHNSELADWDRSSQPGGPKGVLARVSGRVTRIQDGGSGWFTLDDAPGMEVHIVPRRAGLERGRDEGRRLTSLLSFTYSGLKGWDPTLARD